MADVSTTVQLRAWIKDQIADEDEVKLPDLVDKTVGHFITDKKFTERFMREQMRSMVYEIAQKVMASTRGGQVLLLGDDIVTKEVAERRAKALQRRATRWENWMEHAGDRHVRLMDMTADDLQLAITERRMRAVTELRYAGLYEAMLERLAPGSTETVKDRFTADEIETLYRTLDGIADVGGDEELPEAAD